VSEAHHLEDSAGHGRTLLHRVAQTWASVDEERVAVVLVMPDGESRLLRGRVLLGRLAVEHLHAGRVVAEEVVDHVLVGRHPALVGDLGDGSLALKRLGSLEPETLGGLAAAGIDVEHVHLELDDPHQDRGAPRRPRRLGGTTLDGEHRDDGLRELAHRADLLAFPPDRDDVDTVRAGLRDRLDLVELEPQVEVPQHAPWTLADRLASEHPRGWGLLGLLLGLLLVWLGVAGLVRIVTRLGRVALRVVDAVLVGHHQVLARLVGARGLVTPCPDDTSSSSGGAFG